ncbi:insulinase family protein [Natronosporangium hydrolyticum]|uniref:Insulinase family protein n=1 Tax=Natronosporangium hydrolyticum TaxID=2811111 RepID=A0A895YB54_9ACTN|nr:insulinase family protein [Natronosporangium hydrolyticum]QSB12559.1 insulinase family protein [Natronosporangium hydrolyticum]
MIAWPRCLWRDQTLMVNLPRRATAAATLVVESGAAADPPGRAGLATLLARLLQAGTPDMDAELAVGLERLGARFATHAGWDALRLTVEAPRSSLAAAVALMARHLRTAPGASLSGTQLQQHASWVERRWARPAVVGEAAFREAALRGRCRMPLEGTPATARALETVDVERAHGALSAVQRSLLMAGDLTSAEWDEVLGAAGDLGAPHETRQQHARRVEEPPFGQTAPRLVVVDRPGSGSSLVSLGWRLPSYSRDGHAALILYLSALTGAHGSRLTRALRERESYTYSIGSKLDLSRHSGCVAISFRVSRAATASAVRAAVAAIERLSRHGFTANELRVARAYKAGRMTANLQTPRDVCHMMASLVESGRPADDIFALRDEILRLSRARLNSLARQTLSLGRLVVVVVGDASRVRDGLAELPLARIATFHPSSP